jgi:hypothetical protein
MAVRAIILAALFLCAVSGAEAASDRDAQIKSWIPTLQRWIERNSDYKNIAPPTAWVVVTPQQMQARMRAGGVFEDASFARYYCSEKTIYFRDDADFGTLGAIDTLLHELVHHAQCVTQRHGSDICAKESEAYALQARYIRWVLDNQLRSAESETKERIRLSASRVEKGADAICRR